MILSALKQDLKQLQRFQAENYLNHQPLTQLFELQTSQTDQIVRNVWQLLKLDLLPLNLFAIGGYGQQELYPYSDLDLLLLYDESTNELSKKIQQFVGMLWDIGFTPKLVTHHLSSCTEQAHRDLTFYTSLLSLRLLFGESNIYSKLIKKIYSEEIWPNEHFLMARILQRQQELEKYNLLIAPVVYHIKLHPGGLRDFHLIRWLLQKISSSNDWQLLANKNYIDEKILSVLQNNLQTLQALRFGLHFTQQNDDNLLTPNIINNDSNYLRSFLNRGNHHSTFSDDIILNFEQIAAENHQLTQQICSRLRRDFASHP